MESKQNLGKDASFLTLARMLNLLISLITAMLLSRFRTLAEFGTYSQINLVISLAMSLFTLGLPNSINYFYPRADTTNERDEFINNYLSFVTVLSAVTGIILVASIPIIRDFFSNENIDAFFFVLLVVPWTKVIIGSASHLLIASHKVRKSAAYSLLNSLCLVLIILLTRLINQSFMFYMVLYVCVEVLFSLLAYYEGIRLTRMPKFQLQKQNIRRILAFSVPIGIAGSVGTLNAELDKLMIGRFLGTEMMAVYTNAGRELPLAILATSFTAVLMPTMARLTKNNENEEAVRLWGRAIELTYIFMCFFVVVLNIFAPQIMMVLYGEKFLSGLDVFRVYSTVLIWRITYFGMILNITGHSKKVLSSSVASLLLNLVLNYLLFVSIGAIGPALATFVSIGAIQIFQLYESKKILKIKFGQIFPWKKIAVISIYNICLGGIVASLVRILRLGVSTNDIFIAIGIGVVWMTIYLAIFWKTIRRLWHSLKVNSAIPDVAILETDKLS